MGTQAEYTAVANALVMQINKYIATLSGFDQGIIRNYLKPADIDAGASAGAKTAVDTLDALRAKDRKNIMQVSPKVSMWINLIVVLLGALAGAGAQLTPIFGTGVASQIISYSSFAVSVLGLFNTALHGVSAPVAGPITKLVS